MYRAILLSSILAWLGCVTTPAAAGFAPMLTWNTCSGQGGLSDMTLPCSTGGDVHLVATFYTDASILTLTYVARSELGANRMRILGDALQAGRGFALYRGVEYFLFDMDLHLDSAVEAGGSCSGCGAPVTIGLLTQVPLQNDPPVYFTCATANGSAVACSATPARNTTWGVLKSLYR